jgi:hypothetical protein
MDAATTQWTNALTLATRTVQRCESSIPAFQIFLTLLCEGSELLSQTLDMFYLQFR